MSIFIAVTLVSAAGWIVSFRYQRSAAWRHLILGTTLAACLLVPVVVGVRSATDWTLLAIRTSVAASRTNERTVPSALTSHSMEPGQAGRDRGTAASDVLRTSETSRLAKNQDRQDLSSPRKNDHQSEALGGESVRARQSSKADNADWLSMATRWAVILYTAVASVLLLRLVWSFVYVLRVKRQAVEVDILSDGIRVLEADVVVPMAVGFGKPCIVLPHGFRQTIQPAGMRDIMVHEAEHLRRGDHWELLAQGVAAAAYWPIVTVHLVNWALTRAPKNCATTWYSPTEIPQRTGKHSWRWRSNWWSIEALRINWHRRSWDTVIWKIAWLGYWTRGAIVERASIDGCARHSLRDCASLSCLPRRRDWWQSLTLLSRANQSPRRRRRKAISSGPVFLRSILTIPRCTVALSSDRMGSRWRGRPCMRPAPLNFSIWRMRLRSV